MSVMNGSSIIVGSSPSGGSQFGVPGSSRPPVVDDSELEPLVSGSGPVVVVVPPPELELVESATPDDDVVSVLDDELVVSAAVVPDDDSASAAPSSPHASDRSETDTRQVRTDIDQSPDEGKEAIQSATASTPTSSTSSLAIGGICSESGPRISIRSTTALASGSPGSMRSQPPHWNIVAGTST